MSITCSVDMFLVNQTIYHNNRVVARVPLENLSSCLVGLCYNLNCYDIKIRGPKDYLQKYVKEILAIEAESYSNNKINVEVL